jgi:hypothetical protein
MKQRFLSLCGVIAPLLFVFVAILVGFLWTFVLALWMRKRRAREPYAG